MLLKTPAVGGVYVAAPAGTASVATGAETWSPLTGRGVEPSGRVGSERAEELSDVLVAEERVPDPTAEGDEEAGGLVSRPEELPGKATAILL